MGQITASALKRDVEEVLQRVAEDGEQFDIVRDGQVVARILPPDVAASLSQHGRDQQGFRAMSRPLSPAERAQVDAMKAKGEELRRRTPAERAARLARLGALSERIGPRWPDGVSAIDAVRDIRRDL